MLNRDQPSYIRKCTYVSGLLPLGRQFKRACQIDTFSRLSSLVRVAVPLREIVATEGFATTLLGIPTGVMFSIGVTQLRATRTYIPAHWHGIGINSRGGRKLTYAPNGATL